MNVNIASTNKISLQDEKNQLLVTNIWLKLVSRWNYFNNALRNAYVFLLPKGKKDFEGVTIKGWSFYNKAFNLNLVIEMAVNRILSLFW